MENNLYEAIQVRQAEIEANRVSPEEFLTQKKEEREVVNQYINASLEKVSHEPAAYLHFLEMQTKLNLTATNVLAVMAQMPNATMLKDFDRWNKQNCRLKKGCHHIKIFDVVTSFTRTDGTNGYYYPIKQMYDISQLKNPPRLRPSRYTDYQLISAFTDNAAVPITIVDDANLSAVRYNHTSKCIEVPQGLDNATMVSGIATAMCTSIIASKDTNFDQNSYKAYCAESAAYMLCSKYGIPCSKEFAQKTEYFMGNEDVDTVKDMLMTTGDVYKEISGRVDRGLYRVQKQQSERNNEAVR